MEHIGYVVERIQLSVFQIVRQSRLRKLELYLQMLYDKIALEGLFSSVIDVVGSEFESSPFGAVRLYQRRRTAYYTGVCPLRASADDVAFAVDHHRHRRSLFKRSSRICVGSYVKAFHRQLPRLDVDVQHRRIAAASPQRLRLGIIGIFKCVFSAVRDVLYSAEYLLSCSAYLTAVLCPLRSKFNVAYHSRFQACRHSQRAVAVLNLRAAAPVGMHQRRISAGRYLGLYISVGRSPYRIQIRFKRYAVAHLGIYLAVAALVQRPA